MRRTNIRPSDVVPIEETKIVSVDWLVLDRENPRLVGYESVRSDEEIISQFYKKEELREILQSIAANGYLNIEPLIVLAHEESFTVLEGNRRLAAIRLFREPELIERIFDQEKLRINLPPIETSKIETLQEVSVYRVAQRDDARSFIGFKHINGAAKWDSHAKGKFAADWYRNGQVPLEQIAERIGDQHATVKRMVHAIYVLEQAENSSIFSIDNRVNPKFNFSHLYTALSRAPYIEFLGLGNGWSNFELKPNPIPFEREDNLREVLTWLYGSKEDDVQPVVTSQNPDIKHLGEILLNAEGLNVLRANRNLREAYASVRPAEERFVEGLLKARGEIRNVANSLRGFDGRDASLVEIAEDIEETIQTIVARMRKKVRSFEEREE
ncbi:MAG: hypothetical protein OXE94_05985 [Aestuariivita sp.]|nr:hypothetical protein [Aestuariivita sp.]MCY4201476.1 hypothetical protein [Aestuariivita sp.]